MKFFKERFVFLFIIFCIGLFGFFYFEKNQNTSVSSIPSIVTPTPVSAETKEVHSPDGTMNLIMEKQKIGDNEFLYTFSISEIQKKDKKTLFTQTGNTDLFWITANAWSPGSNKYIYILKKDTGIVDALVFQANGEMFSSKQYIDILEAFTKRATAYTVVDVTGWDSPTLLHLITKKEGGVKGPSFWFEVPSSAAIQLY